MQTFLVTGASRGIGLEFVRQLLDRGDRVLAATRTASPALSALGRDAGSRLMPLTLDAADGGSIRAARAAVEGRVEAIDVLVNNAGMYSRASRHWDPVATSFDALSAEDLIETFRVNTVGPLLVTKAFVDLVARSARGRVVNVSSLLGSVSAKTSGGDYPYAASKAALNICTRALAADLAPRGIVAIMMTPGWVRTEMGGTEATLTPEDSVRGMLGVIDGLGRADAGRFVDQEGNDQPW